MEGLQAALCRHLLPALCGSHTVISILYSSTLSEKPGWLYFTRGFEAPVTSSHLACGFREEEGKGWKVVGK